MSWSGAHYRSGGSYTPPTTGEIFTEISQQLVNISHIINAPIIKITVINSVNQELEQLLKKIAQQPNELRFASTREQLFRQVDTLKKAAETLKKDISQLVKNDRIATQEIVTKKSSTQKKINTLPIELLRYIFQFLTAKNIANGIHASTSFKAALYNMPLLDSWVSLSRSSQLALKLTAFKRAPTICELSQARQKAVKSAFFSSYSTNLKKTPQFLEEILKQDSKKSFR